ncbi:MarR family transcriptional regulator [Pokkaliibacter sp. MBI-7]|uniref:MarR family winged helix-turn-helix transcriptional regulator n=1 Tax=Pokkaliibacter sp. MBI-7 TaxID=3040600 RepID=UPI002448C6DC|nr:MarR family transcriptional regulator [Pokkaliibacter sp. MBI-7]MDH2435841.1 MarR family transcriptional regulator [Pokkaliibacter sp. MBI-7]
MKKNVTEAVADDSLSTEGRKPLGVSYLIGRLDRALNRHIRQAIAPLGLTIGQYTALSVFSTRGQLSNAQLAERTMVSPQAANELIKGMEARGWIERQPDPNHGRIIQISLTAEGHALLTQCDDAIAELEAQMLEELSEDEQGTLQKQLRNLVRVLAEI